MSRFNFRTKIRLFEPFHKIGVADNSWKSFYRRLSNHGFFSKIRETFHVFAGSWNFFWKSQKNSKDYEKKLVINAGLLEYATLGLHGVILIGLLLPLRLFLFSLDKTLESQNDSTPRRFLNVFLLLLSGIFAAIGVAIMLPIQTLWLFTCVVLTLLASPFVLGLHFSRQKQSEYIRIENLADAADAPIIFSRKDVHLISVSKALDQKESSITIEASKAYETKLSVSDKKCSLFSSCPNPKRTFKIADDLKSLCESNFFGLGRFYNKSSREQRGSVDILAAPRRVPGNLVDG